MRKKKRIKRTNEEAGESVDGGEHADEGKTAEPEIVQATEIEIKKEKRIIKLK